MAEQLQGSLSQNLLTLIVYHDKALPLIRNIVDPGLFESDFYKHVATLAYNYYAEFKKAPGDHIADLLESVLLSKTKEASAYETIIINLHSNQQNVNVDYTLKQLNTFVRQQMAKTAIIKAHQYVKDGDIDSAEQEFLKCTRQQISVFDPGVWLSDTSKSLQFLINPTPSYPIGIGPLDNINFGPAPGELLVILGPANRGKSQFAVHIARTCAIHRLKVLVVSLEMSEQNYSQRFFQSLFAITKRKPEVTYTRFNEDETGTLIGLRIESLTVPTLQDPDILKMLQTKMELYGSRLKILIKRFPTGALTIKGLEAYLDSLEQIHNYVPDVMILDYADLLQIDQAQLRISTGFAYRELRRIAVERNFAMVTPSQANRLAEGAKVISLQHLAEDYSKAATADNIVAYCQTSLERRFGLARLYIAKARNEERDQTILLSQAYGMGQFCIDARVMSDQYWSLLDAQNTGTTNDQQPEVAQINPRRFRGRS